METKNIAGFVLAGGKSSRMGQDKAMLAIAGEPLLVRATKLIERAIGIRAGVIGPKRDGFAELAFIPDEWQDAGPLSGIATALGVTSADWNLIVACDMPYLTRGWFEFLVQRACRADHRADYGAEHRADHWADADVVLAENNGRLEPLCAMYHKRSEPALRGALQRGTRRVTEALQALRLERIQPTEWGPFDADGCLFKNVNSPVDYEEAKRRLV